MEKMRFTCSNAMAEQARGVIPLGAQTLSRSCVRFPQEYPKFIMSGRGCRVRDVDDNEYIDFICGLGSIILGYRNEAVDSEVLRWVRDKGVGFSLPTALETKLADELLALTPWAQRVRFAKNGSDAVSAAVRLARAHTELSAILILKGGYHGWHDWFACTMEGRHGGIPKHVFADIAVDSIHGVFQSGLGPYYAAVVLEPAHFSDGELKELSNLCKDTKTILIFDEVVSGFRFALGGYHMRQGVEPDLVCFGKAMGNGYPVSALVGKSYLMDRLERDVFFSTTHGGDPVGLSAALATVRELKRTKAIGNMEVKGVKLIEALKSFVREFGLEQEVLLSGLPQMVKVQIPDAFYRSVLLQEMARRGILMYNTNTLCAAHTGFDLASLIDAYREVLPLIKDTSLLVGPVVEQVEVRR